MTQDQDDPATIATGDHCEFCFQFLEAHLQQTPLPKPYFPDALCPLFVTWKKGVTPSSHHHLRGCIGTLEPKQLHKAIRDYTLTSALRDSRFAPISGQELPQLSCTVSLLRCFEEATAWDDWEVGTHGIIIEFTDPQQQVRRSATYLPEVAQEQGWDQQAAVDSLIRKAGYSAAISSALRGSLRLTRYQSSMSTLHFSQRGARGQGGQQQEEEEAMVAA